MTVSPTLAANLGLEARLLYEDTETRLIVRLRRAAEELVAHPEREGLVSLAFRIAVRDEVLRLGKRARAAVTEAIETAYQRGAASAEADLREVGDGD